MDPVSLKLLLFLAVIVSTFGLGFAIANWLRLRDLGLKLGTMLFALGLAVSPFLNTVLVEHRPLLDTLSFGIDLAGGTNLVYQLNGEPKDSGTVGRMVGAIRRRVDPTGTQELAIRQVGKNQIEIIIPKATREEVEQTKLAVTSVGSLEFSVLADRRNQAHQALIAKAKDVRDDLRQSKVVIAGWREVAPLTKFVDGKQVEVPNTENENNPNLAFRQIKGRPEGFKEVLCVFEPQEDRRVTGKYLIRAAAENDPTGNPSVSFMLNAAGGSRFGSLTNKYTPTPDGAEYHLAVLLDDKVQTAPVIRSQITTNGQITGKFTRAEVERIVNILNAGALEVPLNKDPISEFTISPTLGVDVQRKGFLALGISTLGVLIFMAVYYMWLGIVADICLLLNLILLLGAMAFIDATFTLPGLAGVVLTMGMAVDANVLIYERMREEMERGSSMRMAIQNGFGKAFSSIFDSNITTLLTAVILYMIGTDQVKGFAVTLFIGLGISMYTALTVNRLMLEIIERKRWLKQFRMQAVFGVPKFDFVGKQGICAIASCALIGAGLLTFFIRGSANYDIDFSGGTMVAMRFVDSQEADSVQTQLTTAFDEERVRLSHLSDAERGEQGTTFASDVSLEQLSSTDPQQNGKTFRLRTTNQDQNAVVRLINTTFGDKLVKIFVTPGKIADIPDGKPLVLTPEAEKAKAEAVKTDPDADAQDKDPFAGGHQVELAFSAPTRLETAARSIRTEIAKLKTYGGDEAKIKSLVDVSGTEKAEQTEEQAKTGAEYNKVRVRVRKDMSTDDLQKALGTMVETHASTPLLDEVNNFEGSVAKDAKNAAIIAMLASLIMIVGYIWFRFENLYFGLAAVLALVHDVLATLGMLCMAAAISGTAIAPFLLITDFKINLTMIAAFLTIVGYSLNDTIVIFDRLREIRGKNPLFTREMVNAAVNQTLSRTILTAGTVFITVVILYALGGEGIHGFAYAMLVGTVVGCYSTVYVASPFVLVLMNWDAKHNKQTTIGRPVVAKLTSPK
jgi:SecD/SecF fusion protein